MRLVVIITTSSRIYWVDLILWVLEAHLDLDAVSILALRQVEDRVVSLHDDFAEDPLLLVLSLKAVDREVANLLRLLSALALSWLHQHLLPRKSNGHVCAVGPFESERQREILALLGELFSQSCAVLRDSASTELFNADIVFPRLCWEHSFHVVSEGSELILWQVNVRICRVKNGLAISLTHRSFVSYCVLDQMRRVVVLIVVNLKLSCCLWQLKS